MSFANGPVIVTNGLVLSLDAADRNSYPGSGTTWSDLSGNGTGGTLTNGPTFTSNYGGGIVFDGTNDYVPLNNTSLLSTNSITIQTWFLPTSAGGVVIRNRLYGWNITTSLGGIYCNVLPTINVSEAVVIDTGASYVPLNTPVNATLTFGSSTLRLYVNDTLYSSVNAVANTIYYSGQAISIGRDGDSDGGYLNGTVYNVRAYNRALSATEILQNYNAQKSRFNL